MPIGSVAFRVALVSALFGALTVLAIAQLVQRLTRSWPAAVGVSLGFGLLRDQWSQAVIAEVYTLNTFLIGASLLALMRWDERRRPRDLAFCVFLIGLGLANHQTMLATLAAAGLFVTWRRPQIWLEGRTLLLAMAALVVGLLPYLWLPVAAQKNPEVNWGNPATTEAFLTHITRRQYTQSETPPPRSWQRFKSQVVVLREHALDQGAPILLVSGLLSFVWLLFRRPALGCSLLLIALLSSVGIIFYTNFETDFENAYVNRLFFVPMYLVLAVAAGHLFAGLSGILHVVSPRLSAAAPILLIAVFPLCTNWETCDYSDYREVSDYSVALVESVAPNAILFPSSDHNTFPVLHALYVEGRRSDLKVADKFGYLEEEIWRDSPAAQGVPESDRRTVGFRHAVEHWLIATSDRPLYFTHKRALPADLDAQLVPEGLWYRVRKTGTPDEEIRRADRAAWAEIQRRGVRADLQPSPYDYTAQVLMAELGFVRARHELSDSRPEEAVALCRAAAAHVPGSKETLNNLGSLLAENGRFREAREFLVAARALDRSYVTASRNLGLVLRALEETRDAWDVFVDLHQRDPDDAVANRELGEIARAEKRWPQAAFFLERSGVLERNAFRLRDAGLISLYELGDRRRALYLLERSLEIESDQPEVRDVCDALRANDPSAKSGKNETDPSRPRTSRRAGAGPLDRHSGLIPPDPTKSVIPTRPSPGSGVNDLTPHISGRRP